MLGQALPDSLAQGSLVEADQLVIPRGSAHPDEAFEFLRFVSSQEGMELLCLGQKKHTPLLEMSTSFREQHPHPYLDLFHGLSTSSSSFSPPKSRVYNEYLRTFNAAMDEIMNLRRPAREAMERVQERVQRAQDRELRVARRRAAIEGRP